MRNQHRALHTIERLEALATERDRLAERVHELEEALADTVQNLDRARARARELLEQNWEASAMWAKAENRVRELEEHCAQALEEAEARAREATLAEEHAFHLERQVDELHGLLESRCGCV